MLAFQCSNTISFQQKKNLAELWTLTASTFLAKIRPFFTAAEWNKKLSVSPPPSSCLLVVLSITRSGQCRPGLGKFPWASQHADCFSSHGLPTDHAGDFITSVPPETHLLVRGRKAGLSGENICHSGNVHIWAHYSRIFFFSTRA